MAHRQRWRIDDLVVLAHAVLEQQILFVVQERPAVQTLGFLANKTIGEDEACTMQLHICMFIPRLLVAFHSPPIRACIRGPFKFGE